MQQETPNGRPYRSHLQPACIPCRKRKSRCQSEESSEACLMCRAHRTECIFPPESGANQSSTPKSRRRAKRDSRASAARTPRNSSSVPGPVSVPPPDNSVIEQSTLGIGLDSIQTPTHRSIRDTTARNAASGISPLASRSAEWPQRDAQPEESPLALGSNDGQQHNLHIVGPAVTSDNQVLSDYLSAMPSSARGSRIVRPVPGNRSRPVLFTMVQKRPVGLDSNRSFPEERLQLIEKILEPFASDVLDV
jgi:hypothetical protein